MRIAFLCTSSLDDASPRGRWLPIGQELAHAGHTPYLLMLHPMWDRLRQRSVRLGGVEGRYVAPMHVYGYPGARRYYGPLKLMGISLRAALALAAEAARLRPDLLHIAKPQPINGLAGLLAARLLGVPMLVDCDDYEAGANRFGAGWQQRIVQFCEDALPHQAQGVTVNTLFLQQRYRQAGIRANHIAYVPNGVSAAQFQRRPPGELQALRAALGLVGHPTLIYLGTMSTIAHGTGLLLEAFRLVHRQLPHARLLMVGDGDDRASLAAYAAELGLGASVIWTGRVPASAARSFLALADASTDPVFDTPAMAARSPLKVAESLAAGTPVITGDVGDRRRLIGDGAGHLVNPGDPRALAGGIALLLSNEPLRRQLAQGARARAETLRWERLARPWVELVEQVAKLSMTR
jgi:glycosyltransferase involved in cell wall biosynthesis